MSILWLKHLEDTCQKFGQKSNFESKDSDYKMIKSCSLLFCSINYANFGAMCVGKGTLVRNILFYVMAKLQLHWGVQNSSQVSPLGI